MTDSLTKLFAHKVKTADELRLIIGDRPRKNKVIMCHGIFDVVHPGHLRHLIFAKGKAQILVTSLTADRHITKGESRPHVPQDLRAANLAAYELVDYVVIDDNATPIENIKIIQPDYFVKGYEYNVSGMHPKTAEEVATLASYGGEVLFSPGDIVYSSSKLINLAPPEIKYDKLITLMEREKVSFASLRKTLSMMNNKKVHVVGDTIVDSFTRCTMIGGQTKTPTMSVLFESREEYVGGAGVVAKHLQAAGAEVTFSTVLGNDLLRDFVLTDMDAAGVEVRPYIDATRPTTNKNAVVVGSYRLLKIDTLDNRSVGDGAVNLLSKQLRDSKSDAVVFSDFRHGIFNRNTIPLLVASIPNSCYRVADSQVASRWGNITDFSHFDLITPNEREARFALGDQDSQIRSLASALYSASKCKNLILKLGDKGVLTYKEPHPEDLDGWFVVDSFVDHVVDAVGAGDALLAYATLAMIVSASIAQATILGSFAAACECEHDGNIPITQSNMLAKLELVEQQCNFG